MLFLHWYGNCLGWPSGKASASRAEDMGIDPWFPLLSQSSDLKLGTQVTLPSTLCYRVIDRTGWPIVCVLWMSEIASLICSFYVSVAVLHYLSKFVTEKCLICGRDIRQTRKHITWAVLSSDCFLTVCAMFFSAMGLLRTVIVPMLQNFEVHHNFETAALTFLVTSEWCDIFWNYQNQQFVVVPVLDSGWCGS